MSRSGDFCADRRQTDRRTKPIALPLAHVRGINMRERGVLHVSVGTLTRPQLYIGITIIFTYMYMYIVLMKYG
jgi:hypothetical protein